MSGKAFIALFVSILAADGTVVGEAGLPETPAPELPPVDHRGEGDVDDGHIRNPRSSQEAHPPARPLSRQRAGWSLTTPATIPAPM
jgi:hypothetical protein